jgi:hypothetical protein
VTSPNTDWSSLGQNLFLLLLGLLTAWNAWRAKKTAGTVEQIHTLTNSAMGLSLKSLAEVTAAKAAITKDPADLKAATEAMNAYLSHVSKQATVDSSSNTTPAKPKTL